MAGSICHIKFGNAAKLSPLLNELSDARNRPYRRHLILPSYNNDAAYLRKRFPEVHLHFLRLKSREFSASQHPLLKAVRYREFVRLATRKAREIETNLYVAHDATALIPAMRAKRSSGVPVLYRAHELYSEAGGEISPLLWLWKRVERKYVPQCDAMVVPEIHRAQIYRDEYGAKELPAVVRNIPPVREPYTGTEFLRERLGRSGDTVLCLYQGLVSRSRCIEELIEAFRYLPEKYNLVIVGNVLAEYRDILDDKARRWDIEERIHRLPFIPPEELGRVTASADIGCLLYRNNSRNNYYAAPNKLYEYLFAGLPVVVSSFPALIAPVEEHGAGSWADPEQPEDIARAIERAGNIPGGAELAGRMRAAFRWEEEYARLEEVYRNTMKPSHAND